MRALKARAKILGVFDYYFYKKYMTSSFLNSMEGVPWHPPCRMLATPLVGCVYAEALTFVKRDRTVSKFRAGNFGVGQATL